MNTPICDFVKEYAVSQGSRFHMPGHKGMPFLGCEAMDITEIAGADELYGAEGIIAESEKNASVLFGTARTVFSTEGSSQCIRAMLHLVTMHRKEGKRPLLVAARNVHKTFLSAAVLLDAEVVWLQSKERASLCSSPVRKEELRHTLQKLKDSGRKPDAVYVTSPDYLGTVADIPGLALVCHEYGTVLAVDNAHGAYLHFLEIPQHPMDLGADICCDSAHKTLPVLTGGAYLHISRNAPKEWGEQAKPAMELFGSTSPSYLILQSLDLCNRYLAEGYENRLSDMQAKVVQTKKVLEQNGWECRSSEPLKITVWAPEESNGKELAQYLREHQIECEYADTDMVVLMVTPENQDSDLKRLTEILTESKVPGKGGSRKGASDPPKFCLPKAGCPIRKAYFSEGEVIPVEKAEGRICRRATATCPPAVPIVVPGEYVDKAAIECFRYYGMEKIDVIREE